MPHAAQPMKTSRPSPKALAKQTARDSALTSAPTYNSAEHDPFITVTAAEIVRRIGAGEWTASRVLEAYIARAAVAQLQTNCITEVLFKDARKQANELDVNFKKTNKLRGPLHGVPMSFKDQYEIAGYDASIGFTDWCNKPSSKDAFVVAKCRAAGAIVIVKTNVPQTMFAFECSNPVWGRTLNPWNDKYTCGGSSGGEAALLALDGSALGAGSDIGGSLRIPTSYCGVYALKPSASRVSGDGCVGPNNGFEAIHVSFGPIARSVEDCDLFCRVIFGELDSSHKNVPIPYNPIELTKKLKFGYYSSDNLVHPSPAVVRAVKETVDALRRAGHECVEFSTPLAIQAMKVFVGLLSADGYKKMLSHLKGDTQEDSLFLSTLGTRIPGFVRNLICWSAKTFFSDSTFADFLSLVRGKSVLELHELIEKRKKIEEAWYTEVWQGQQFDGIIAPVQAMPTIPHGACSNLSGLAAATFLYNVIDSPVGVVPVTRVDASLDKLPPDFKLGASGGSKVMEKWMYTSKDAVYNPTEMKGIPVGVQIIGKKWEDEKVLAMMRVVDEALGARGFGPGQFRGMKQ